MTKTEVTPGMFSLAEVRPSWKTPSVLALFSGIVLVLFGFLGKPGDVTYNLSNKGDIFSVPDVVVASTFANIVLGTLMLVAAAYSGWLTIREKHTPMWVSLVAGLFGATGLLGWLAAGNTVPVSFILGSAVVLAVPIILGALGGLMSERVGVVNIAIEGQLLTGAFMAAVVGTITQNLWFGLIAAMVASINCVREL